MSQIQRSVAYFLASQVLHFEDWGRLRLAQRGNGLEFLGELDLTVRAGFVAGRRSIRLNHSFAPNFISGARGPLGPCWRSRFWRDFKRLPSNLFLCALRQELSGSLKSTRAVSSAAALIVSRGPPLPVGVSRNTGRAGAILFQYFFFDSSKTAAVALSHLPTLASFASNSATRTSGANLESFPHRAIDAALALRGRVRVPVIDVPAPNRDHTPAPATATATAGRAAA